MVLLEMFAKDNSKSLFYNRFNTDLTKRKAIYKLILYKIS